MNKEAYNPEDLVEIHSRSAGMMLRAQAAIDEGLTLAALTLAEADGKTRVIDPERRVAIARAMMRHAHLARFYFGPAMQDGEPTDAGLLRAMSGVYDDEPRTEGILTDRAKESPADAGWDKPTGYCTDHGEYDPAGNCPGCEDEDALNRAEESK